MNNSWFVWFACLLGVLSCGFLQKFQAEWQKLVEAQACQDQFVLHGEELDKQRKAAHGALETREAVLRKLLAGHMSLRQAAAQFKAVDHEAFQNRSLNYFPFPGLSWEERYCRQVICWVEVHMRRYPETYDKAFLEGLQNELADVIHRNGE